jgi:hypothetical protein
MLAPNEERFVGVSEAETDLSLVSVWEVNFVLFNSMSCKMQAFQEGAVPGTFTRLKWSLVPPNFKECCVRYS